MARPEHYQVPLVLYVDGVRHVVGRASINATRPGEIIAQISQPIRDELRHILDGDHKPTEFSIEYSKTAKLGPSQTTIRPPVKLREVKRDATDQAL